MTETRTLVLIPARMAATRLPGKPLLDIAGLPMIVHVLRRAEAAGIGRVAVATDTPDIAAAVTAAGGEAIMTRADHPSGSDRIFEALGSSIPRAGSRRRQSPGRLSDHPPDNIRAVLTPLADPAVDIATLAAEIHTEEEAPIPNVVKVVGSPVGASRLRALYFTRATAPYGEGRATITSAFTPIAARRWNVSSSCRPRRWSGRRSSSSCGRWKPECGSTSRSWTRVPRGVDTPADLETARRILAKSLSSAA